MKRRAFITLLGGAAVSWPLAARAQQPDRVRRIGFQGRDVAIEYRWAENQYDRLPSLAAELIHRQVSVIATLTTPSAIAAKAATAIIPIVFTTIADPVQIGLVASLNRPGGNLTGVTILNVEIVPKMLELLHEVVPTATTMAALVNPTNPNAATWSTSLQVAARTLGLELNVLKASTERDIDTAFATLIPLRVGGLAIVNDVFIITREEQLAALALRHRVPTIFQTRTSVVAGGLMSYAGSASDADSAERFVAYATAPFDGASFCRADYWDRFYAAWLAHAQSQTTLILRFEDFKRSPADSLSAVCRFLDVAASAGEIDNAVTVSDFSNIARIDRALVQRGLLERTINRAGRVREFLTTYTPAMHAVFADGAAVRHRFGCE